MEHDGFKLFLHVWIRTQFSVFGAIFHVLRIYGIRAATLLFCGVQLDLVKDNGHLYFVHFLESAAEPGQADLKALAAFILTVMCEKHPKARPDTFMNAAMELPVSQDSKVSFVI